MASQYTEWFKTQADSSWLNQSDVETVEAYLTGIITINDTILRLNSTGPAMQKHLSPERKTAGRVSGMLNCLAEGFPEAHAAIIELLKEIYLKEDPTGYGWILRDQHECW
jgi:hypothetical protein